MHQKFFFELQEKENYVQNKEKGIKERQSVVQEKEQNI